MITSEERAGHRSALTVATWELWKRPKHWIAYTGLSVATMLALTGVFAASIAITSSQVLLCSLLAGLAIAHTEATRRIERQRRSMSVTPHINMTSVWVLPGAILLPPQLTALLVTVIYLHLGYRSWAGLRTVNPHRTVANATSMTLTAFAAWAAVQIVGAETASVTSICAASLAFFLMNAVFTGTGLYFAAPKKATVQTLLGSWDDNILEASTVCIGALVLAVLPHQPVLVLLVFLPLYLLQRSVLIKQLEELATTDQKTQLLNATTWQQGAVREVSRAERENGQFGALMIDLDHFKSINDTYGHLAGDDVLKGVAALVKAETRTQDLAGRFGGEEFVVLLTSSSKQESVAVAERIRQRISEMVIKTQDNEGNDVVIEQRTASVGVATFPLDGRTIDEVMASADASVYAAKRNGRNRVVSSPDLASVTEEAMEAVAA
ncbi:GGDEF domain-containing protein [Amycolatopsis sp. WAC 04197]|uniref:GGDEF domain-containing protein n=1 Tax=Amycolatopsis sp. WAC 04197 TaxID=2203199 RepID=UPI000F788225|nr:GGDEF domain-containing protein [Amycolatopsis sp. WAC 04197]RSN47184.1 GGDEF domain-containing protein [Amycolatopsis sp. WAC 04197]